MIWWFIYLFSFSDISRALTETDCYAVGQNLWWVCVFFLSSTRCNVDNKVSRVAWLNRTTILFAGSEKWSLDPRVILMENTAATEYSIKIQNVDVHDEGPYVCSILTNKKPKSTKVHLIVQGKMLLPYPHYQWLYSAVTNNQGVKLDQSWNSKVCWLLCSLDVHFYTWSTVNSPCFCVDLTRTNLQLNQI